MWFGSLSKDVTEKENKIATHILKDINERLTFLINVGLDYLNLSRGSGTLSEVCAAYMSKKPMVAIRGFDSAIAPYIDGYVDHRKNVKIIGADTPKEAVEKILELITA